MLPCLWKLVHHTEAKVTEPPICAYIVVQEIMQIGSAKDGKDESWREKSLAYHAMKALRHTATAVMQAQGITPPDGENHLKLAITRLAMALSIETPP